MMKHSLITTLMLLLAVPACSDDKDDTDTDSASATDGTGATAASATDATATDATAAETTAAETTAAETTAADTTAADTTAATTTGATTAEPTTGAAGLSFAADVWEPILVTQCGCHQVGASGGLLMGMDAASAYAAMVNVPSSNGMPYVTPGDPANSYMFHKVSGTQLDAGGGGSTMPLGAPKLGQADLDAISAWIADGAGE
jgi:hypothetical protein